DDGVRVGLATTCVGKSGGVGAGLAVQLASTSANARESFLRSGWALGGRLPEPSHDDLVGAVDLLVDLPTHADPSIDVRLAFPYVGVLADHRLTLPRPTRPQLARRERAADLRP